MSSSARCPACGRAFPVVDPGVAATCPGCGASVVVRASEGAAPPGAGAPRLRRRCRACGERYPADLHVCPACGLSAAAARAQQQDEEEADRQGIGFGLQKKGFGGGLAMVGIGGAWLFIGLQADRLYYYPIGLIVVGLIVVVQALLSGSPRGRRRG